MPEPEQSLRDGDGSVAVSPSFGGKKKRVLLVEEDPLARAFLLSKLRMEGIDVDVAWNGKLALKKLPGGQLDAIFLDLLHSDVDGQELIAAARRDPEFGNRPIYVCTKGPASGTSARHRTNAKATKVFNRASNSVESIVAAVAADLLGAGPEFVEPEAAEPMSRESLRREQFADIPPKRRQNLTWLCTHLPLLEKCKDEKARVAKCRELLSKVHSVVTEANAARLENMAREAAALLGFLKELCDKPQRFADSSLRTIASAVDALQVLSDDRPALDDDSETEFSVVIVDADLFSRTATSNALRTSGFRLSTFEDASMALEHLRTHPVDLVVVDLPVPKLSGMDVCEKLCEASLRSRTPVILVGNRRDLKRSARILSKGVESIIKPNRSRLALRALSIMLTVGAKARELKRSSRKSAPTAAELVVRPFVSMELSLKALSMVLKNRAQKKAADRARAAILATPQTAAPPAKTEAPRDNSAPEPAAEDQSRSAVAVEAAPAGEPSVEATTTPEPEQPSVQAEALESDQPPVTVETTDGDASTAQPPVLDAEPATPANRTEDTSVWISVKATRDGARQWKPANTDGAPDPDAPAEGGPLPSLPDVGIVDIDAEGKIVSASDLCSAMFGWRNLVGEHIGKVLKGGLDNDLGRKIDSSNGTREESVVRVTALRRDGTEFPASVILTPILQESKVSWSAVFRVVIPRDESRRSQTGETTMRTRSGTARLFRRHNEQPSQEVASND
ncbi:MAG TPA: response regulator, partial [Verrucomicrobiae bacterium]|nr:response regulator [Verrucomicrobiae bacterium]